MTPKQIFDLLTTPEGREELRVMAAEPDGWTGIYEEVKPAITYLCGYNDEWCHPKTVSLIPHYPSNATDLTEAERRLGLHDRANVSLRVRYTQHLHELVALQPDTPVNNAGTPVVSDLDKYFAPTELKCCAYVLTAQWKAKQPTPETK